MVIVNTNKKPQFDNAITNFNVLFQGYTNATNLETDIRDRKDNVTIAVVDHNMLDKVPALKSKYPHCTFIL